ncbi:hypothetical protein ACH79_40755 [Bradyrhizobium sp. CCBAU 051011]|uniref:HipA domain-containing protein n=1 Tax=Bradyrhizobium sp. CCBAU 051011 TaxID=858422 RepID=UPI00137440A8|nr:hypothetical protein ACH79_40755 [Bradyrhizobium sp. CCBAU 051011]
MWAYRSGQDSPQPVAAVRLAGWSWPGADDQAALLRAQIFSWLIVASDDYAKNFSIFITPAALSSDTLYDVLTAQPRLDAGQIQRKHEARDVGRDKHSLQDCPSRRPAFLADRRSRGRTENACSRINRTCRLHRSSCARQN